MSPASTVRPLPGHVGPTPPHAELKQFEIHAPSVHLLSLAYCRTKHLVVLGVVDPVGEGPIQVGMLSTTNEAMVDYLEGLLGRPITPVQLSAQEIERALQTAEGKAPVDDAGRLKLRPTAEISFSPNAPLEQILHQILGRAIGLSSTDIHFETYEDDVDVRFRIDGLLQHMNTPLHRQTIAAAISRLKILGGLDITERRRAQDGRILATYEAENRRRNIDFRLSVVPGPFGEDAVLRVLDSSKPLIGLSELGMPDAVAAKFEELICNPEGLVVVSGPTGSGKTTTLYAALLRISVADKKILTVEDPIEYSFEKINQKQVSETMGFADYARAFLRQNPDIMMIGEIRDEATAEAAFRASQTGHLVLSTLHTNDAVQSVARLQALGADLNVIAGSLLGALSQRLVRRICEACREEVAPDERERAMFSLGPGGPSFFRGRGCAACHGQGYAGRLGLYELFVADEGIADMITSEAPNLEIRRRARAQGMTSLLDDGLDKARSGRTSLSEILRVVPFRIITAERPSVRNPAPTLGRPSPSTDRVVASSSAARSTSHPSNQSGV